MPNLGANFNIDITQLKTGLAKANALVKENESKFKLATAGMQDWSKTSDGLKSRLTMVSSVMEIQKERVRALQENYDKLVKEGLDKTSTEAIKLRTQIANETAALNKNESEAKNLKEELKRMDDCADDAGEAMKDAGEKAEKSAEGWSIGKSVISDLISNVITHGIQKIKEFGREAIQAGMDFSASMSEVAAISGATAEEQELLEEKARELGESTKYSATEVSQAFKYMSLAGWSVNDSISGISGILNLAAASGMDLAAASDAVTDYLSAFGMEAKDATYMADLLAFAQANANTSAEQMTEAYRNSAASLSASGQGIETVTALLSMMANQGLKGSESGTALAAVMRDITSKMDEGSIKIGNTAVTVADASGNFRNLTDILIDVENATNGMGTAEKAAALQTTFTAKSLKGLNLLLNAGTKTAKSFENRLRGSTGAASDMSEVMQDNLTGDVTKMKSAVEGAEIELYKEFEPTLRNVVQTITKKTIPAITDFIKSLKDNKIVRGAAETVKYLVSHLGDVAKVVIPAVVAIKGFTIVSSITRLVQGFGGALSGIVATLAANPFGLALTAIAGVATAIGVVSAAENKRNEDLKKAAEDKANTQYYRDQKEAIDDTAKSWDDFVNSVNDTTFDNVSDIDYYGRLLKELELITEENGHVKSGYEDRARFIVDQLNEGGLLDREIKFNEGVIEDLQNTQKELQDLIQLRRAEAILAGEKEIADEARGNQTKYAAMLSNAKKGERTALNELREYGKTDYKRLLELAGGSEAKKNLSLQGIDVEQFEKRLRTGNGSLEDYYRLSQMVNSSDQQLIKFIKAYETAIGNVTKQQKTHDDAIAKTLAYEADYMRIMSGDAEEIAKVNARMSESYVVNGEKITLSLEEQYRIALEDLNTVQKLYWAGSADISEETIAMYQGVVDDLENKIAASKPSIAHEWEETGTQSSGAYASGIKHVPQKTAEAIDKTKEILAVQRSNVNTGIKNLASEGQSGFASWINNIISSTSKAIAETIGIVNNKKGVLSTSFGQMGSDSKLSFEKGLNLGNSVSNIFSGIINSFTSAKSSLVGAMSGVSRVLQNTFDVTNEIASPSKWYERRAGYIPEGVAQGIRKKVKLAATAVKDMNSRMQNSMDISYDDGGKFDQRKRSDSTRTSNTSTFNQYNYYSAPHSDYEMYKTEQNMRRLIKRAVRA